MEAPVTKMSPKPEKAFSLAEANALVPRVADITADVVHHLEVIRQSHGIEEGADVPLPESVLGQIQEALAEWSQSVQETGALPKGFFTVDFPSLDPELLYCWTYGEQQIGYTHKVWENFSHRRPLGEAAGGQKNHMHWVH